MSIPSEPIEAEELLVAGAGVYRLTETWEIIDLESDSCLCSKCNSSKLKLHVIRVIVSKGAFGFMTMHRILIKLFCAECNKRIGKRRWSFEIRSLEKQKREEYKIPWHLTGLGRMSIIFGIFFLYMGLFYGHEAIEDRKKEKRGYENFSYAYGDSKTMWLDNLEEGDVLFEYLGSSASRKENFRYIFIINYISGDTLMLDKYIYAMPCEEVSEMSKFDLARLENVKSEPFRADKNFLYKYGDVGHDSIVLDSNGSILSKTQNRYYIRQIIKKKNVIRN